MDSERPAPQNPERRFTRPLYLVASMVLLWMLGVGSMREGAATLVKLREGVLPDLDTIVRFGGDFTEVLYPLLGSARLAALGAVPQLSFPLSAIGALLSSTLVVAATLVLLGRPSARTFALQAIGANAVFAIVEFVLLRHVRGVWIEAAARAAAVIQDPTLPGDPVEQVRLLGYWSERAHLVLLELGIPLLAALALTRPRTKVYFAEAAAAADGAEEEP